MEILTSHSEDADKRSGGPFLVISRHDFRSRRKANMHFITEELSHYGKTRFFSFGFSLLSRLKDDPRLSLWKQSNTVETVNGVECYLWRTPLHPVNLRNARLRTLEALLFKMYIRLAPAIFRQWIAESDTIVFESGFPIIFIRLCKAINPTAKLLYIASDGLRTIDCAEYIINEFEQLAPTLNGIRLPSHWLREDMPPGSKIFFVPHGLDKSIANHADPSPYTGGINAVSVGSMLFDTSFFEMAAAAFPEITFHVIGGGANASSLKAPNIRLYDEMPFLKTIPYVKHANIGIAPYNGQKVAKFLVDTSMKLIQYGFLGLPAVCPELIKGSYPGRFGYTPGDQASIATAIRSALGSGNFSGNKTLSWPEVTERILNPANFDDTRVEL